MEIRKLFGQGNGLAAANAKKEQEAVSAYQQQNEAAQKARNGEDVVSLSSLSRQLSQVSNIVEDDNRRRADRVDALKARIESGDYKVSSSDVAASIVSFAQDVPAPSEA